MNSTTPWAFDREPAHKRLVHQIDTLRRGFQQGVARAAREAANRAHSPQERAKASRAYLQDVREELARRGIDVDQLFTPGKEEEVTFHQAYEAFDVLDHYLYVRFKPIEKPL